MFSYEGGIAIAAMAWLYNAISIVVWINSRYERNLNRIGQRLSWLTLSPAMMEEGDLEKSLGSKIGKYLLIVGLNLLLVLTSWLYVALVVSTWLYTRAKDSGAPQAVREFRWRMRNQEMTFDQIMKELMKVSDEPPDSFEEYRANFIRQLDEYAVPRSNRV